MKLDVPVHGVNVEQLSEAVGISTYRLNETLRGLVSSTRLDPCVGVTCIGDSIVFYFSAATELLGHNNFNEELLKKILFAENYFQGEVEDVFLASRNSIYEYGEETERPVTLGELKEWLELGKGTLSSHDPIPLSMDLINDKREDIS